MCFPSASVPSNDSAEKAAQQAREDENNRQANLASGNQAINGAFSGYDNNYYGGLAKKYSNYYTPQLENQYSNATQNALFNAARAGIVDSSAAAKTNADLARSHGEQQQSIQSGAQSYANQARSQIGSQRSALQNQLMASGGNVDVGNLTQVQAPTLPTLTPLGDLFTNTAGVVSNQARVQALQNGANGVGVLSNQNQQGTLGVPAASKWIS